MDKPEYPNFKKITIEDVEIFKKLTNLQEPYSDYNLLSLLSWNISGSNSFSVLNNNLVLKMKQYLGEDFMYLLYGTNHIDETISGLIPEVGKLCMVPEDTINNISHPEKYKIEEDRDNFDYVLSIKEIAKLEGNKYKSLRKQTNNFKEMYPDYHVRKLNLGDPNQIEKIQKLTRDWGKDKGFDEGKILEDIEITNNFITFSNKFDCVSIGIFVEDIIVAFTFNEILNNNWIMGHFGKGDVKTKGSMTMAERETEAFFESKGYTLLNYQQDTGIEALRNTKMGYRPIRFLKKYTVSAA